MSEKISILVVDDEEHIRNILEYNLRLEGFEVYLAENGRTGLEYARQKKPDVILLDWMMPEMDGLEVISELKRDKTTEHIPVFMLTAKGTSNDLGIALVRGADDYIVKPFEPEELGELVRHKLKSTVKN
ncbi:MAG: response regulator transcription factor [Planctomycetota bacterium]|jgi:DNA-binding response OmpR family regulator